jgi:hypothetical protein
MYSNSGTLTGGSLYAFDTRTHELLETARQGASIPTVWRSCRRTAPC